jgi:hypothetical protein
MKEKGWLIGWVWPMKVHSHYPNDLSQSFVEASASIAYRVKNNLAAARDIVDSRRTYYLGYVHYRRGPLRWRDLDDLTGLAPIQFLATPDTSEVSWVS